MQYYRDTKKKLRIMILYRYFSRKIIAHGMSGTLCTGNLGEMHQLTGTIYIYQFPSFNMRISTWSQLPTYLVIGILGHKMATWLHMILKVQICNEYSHGLLGSLKKTIPLHSNAQIHIDSTKTHCSLNNFYLLNLWWNINSCMAPVHRGKLLRANLITRAWIPIVTFHFDNKVTNKLTWPDRPPRLAMHVPHFFPKYF